MKHQRAWLLHSTSWQARNTRSEMLRGVCMRRVAAVLSMLIVVSLIALQMLIVLPSAARPIPQLMVTPRPTPTEVPNLAQFVNADFEQGHIGWTEIPSTTIIAQLTGHLAHSGQWVAWLGGDKGNTDVVSQTITLPTGSPLYLRFYYFVPDSSTEPDYMIVRANGTHLFGFPIYVPTSWKSATINISHTRGRRSLCNLKFRCRTRARAVSTSMMCIYHLAHDGWRFVVPPRRRQGVRQQQNPSRQGWGSDRAGRGRQVLTAGTRSAATSPTTLRA
jgi:hypothetical protein